MTIWDETCPICDGAGEVPVPTTAGAEHGEELAICPTCHGTCVKPWKLQRNLVLVQEEEREEVRSSGLYIPESPEEPPDWVWGHVLAKGPDCRDVTVGDRGLYHRFMGRELLTRDWKPALVLEETEIALLDIGHRERVVAEEIDRLERLSTGEMVALKGGERG